MHNIKQLSDREHILKRPAMYIGSVTPTKSKEYILEDNKIQYKEIQYAPGLIKIINEVIDNSVDVAIKTNFKSSNLIEVMIDSKKVIIQDNGTGIPIVKNKEGHYLPELCWNHARAGSNFDNDENRTQIGMNGVGAYSTACFSKKFIGTTDDGKKSYKIIIKNNASEFTEEVGVTGNQGTIVSFNPDLERFGLNEIDETHQLIIKQRLINLSMSFPEITFKFNRRKINTNNFRNYLKLFSDTFEMYESSDGNFKFAILPNDSDNFRQFSYVNGLNISDGGTHIDTVMYNIVNGIRGKLIKRYKTIKPGDIKNKLMIIVFIKNFSNTKFNSQSKEKLTNSIKEVNDFIGEVDYQKIVNKIIKTPEIIDNITELYRAKEEIARRKMLKNADKKKKLKSEKFMPPIGSWKRIFVCEGDSASNSISKLLGRTNQGFYAMFGVPPNAYSSSMSDILKSKKMTDLKDILGLKYSEAEQNDINFEEIIITTDYDLPGHFITGQLIGLLYKFGKNLFSEKRVKRLVTPLLVCTDSKEKIVNWFYTFEDFKAFEAKHKAKKYHYDYKKGLGSWDQDELSVVIAKDGLENMLEVYQLDDLSSQRIEAWLGKDSQARKDLLEGVQFDVMSI